MKHSSVNGLVSEEAGQEMYDMIVENSRKYFYAPSSADAKALQTEAKDRKNLQDQSTGKFDGLCVSLVWIN